MIRPLFCCAIQCRCHLGFRLAKPQTSRHNRRKAHRRDDQVFRKHPRGQASVQVGANHTRDGVKDQEQHRASRQGAQNPIVERPGYLAKSQSDDPDPEGLAVRPAGTAKELGGNKRAGDQDCAGRQDTPKLWREDRAKEGKGDQVANQRDHDASAPVARPRLVECLVLGEERGKEGDARADEASRLGQPPLKEWEPKK